MDNFLEQYNRRKLISSYFSVTFSISLVLFLLGTLLFLVLNTKKITDNFKEQISIFVFLKNNAKDADIKQLQKTLSVSNYCKSVTFVSKEQAAKDYSKELGEDFIEFIGDNPLYNSFDLKLNADFVEPEKIKEISEEIQQNVSVYEVSYNKVMISEINENIKNISIVILTICGFFTIVAILLINASIRLSVYSKRFIIKTMQLVGATKNFIRRPFILTNILLGIIGALLAYGILYLCLLYFDSQFPDLNLFDTTSGLTSIFFALVLIGAGISWVSTYFAAQRFLNLHTDDLYV